MAKSLSAAKFLKMTVPFLLIVPYQYMYFPYSSNVLEDEDVIGSSITDARGAVFFCIFAVNKDSGTHPNIFLEITLLQNSCQDVCDSNGLVDTLRC